MRQGLGMCTSVVCVLVALARPPLSGLQELAAQEGEAVVLPAGVRAAWDLGKAYRETTATRERVCINGLWRWQPAEAGADEVPADGWGFFKGLCP